MMKKNRLDLIDEEILIDLLNKCLDVNQRMIDALRHKINGKSHKLSRKELVSVTRDVVSATDEVLFPAIGDDLEAFAQTEPGSEEYFKVAKSIWEFAQSYLVRNQLQRELM